MDFSKIKDKALSRFYEGANENLESKLVAKLHDALKGSRGWMQGGGAVAGAYSGYKNLDEEDTKASTAAKLALGTILGGMTGRSISTTVADQFKPSSKNYQGLKDNVRDIIQYAYKSGDLQAQAFKDVLDGKKVNSADLEDKLVSRLFSGKMEAEEKLEKLKKFLNVVQGVAGMSIASTSASTPVYAYNKIKEMLAKKEEKNDKE